MFSEVRCDQVVAGLVLVFWRRLRRMLASGVYWGSLEDAQAGIEFKSLIKN